MSNDGWALVNVLPDGNVQVVHSNGASFVVPRAKWQQWMDEAWDEAARAVGLRREGPDEIRIEEKGSVAAPQEKP